MILRNFVILRNLSDILKHGDIAQLGDIAKFGNIAQFWSSDIATSSAVQYHSAKEQEWMFFWACYVHSLWMYHHILGYHLILSVGLMVQCEICLSLNFLVLQNEDVRPHIREKYKLHLLLPP